MGELIDFQRPDGKQVSGYLAAPASGDGPGIVVIQEWWGLNAQIRGVADRLAQAGYRALVPDLYRGKVTLEAAEARHLMQGLDFGDAASQDIRGAVQYLKAASDKVGITGFCMGGALTLLAAANAPEADAAAAWYGYPPLQFLDPSKIKVPLLGHFATEDSFFAIAGVDDFEAKLRDAKVNFEFHRYQANHAFANETATTEGGATRYNAEAADLAWQRTLAFFGKHLR